MALSDPMARAVMQNIHEQMERCLFPDVTVVVEDTTFKCHRFLLSACSEFFRATFSSGMQEDLNKKVSLKGISPETFSLVIDCMYRARNILNPDNVNSVWHAANQLQIGFIIEACEMFHTKQLSKDNCDDIYINAKMLDSKKLLELSWDLIIKEFEHLRKTDEFLMLDIDDMLKLVSDETLDVTSEDVVIDTILRWINYDPNETIISGDDEASPSEEIAGIEPSKKKQKHVSNKDRKSDDKPIFTLSSANENSSDNTKMKTGERKTSAVCYVKESDRKKYLPQLLAASKVCLVSGTCIQSLVANKLVIENPEAFAIVQEALRYQLQPGRRHDSCPPYAVHRNTSPLKNGVISIRAVGQAAQMSCRTNDGVWYQLAAPPAQLLKCEALVYENDIYATSTNAAQPITSKYDSTANSWRNLANMTVPRTNHSLLCLNGFIYAVGGDNCTAIERFNARDEQRTPGSGKWEKVGNLKEAVKNTMAASFGSFIIIFGSISDSTTSTTIQLFDTQTMSTHHYLDDMPGSAKNMVSLRYGENLFVLQEVGTLWQVAHCDKSKFTMEFQGMLWDFAMDLAAAVIHNQELLILCRKVEPLMPRKWDTANNALFKRLKILERDGNCLLNNVIKKTLLVTKET